MNNESKMSPIALAVAAAIGASLACTAAATNYGGESKGTYVSGDFHNHTTCSDGSISMQKLVKKSTDKNDTPWGLDWFVQAGHGGNGNRNCTLVEDASLATPAYPQVVGKGPTTTWADSIGAAAVKGNTASATATSTTPLSSTANPSMWRWQSIQEYQYPVTEYLAARKDQPVFIGLESVVAGHEHTSMSVVTGQNPPSIFSQRLPNSAGYSALGNATALAKWSYCFDRGDTDNSRGAGQNWDCSVPGSANTADPDWNAVAAKLVPLSGAGVGARGHAKTVEAVKWMAKYHPKTSYYVPAHLERAGPFNPDGNNGFNIEHLRNFNNAGPGIAFGMETQPGHHASGDRGEYRPDRNNIGGVLIDSVGGTTYGGTGVYGAQIGGVWDALLGEGRNFWFFASSDWHNRGSFGPDDRRSTQDFYPGEYQRDYVMVKESDRHDHHRGGKFKDKDVLSPAEIVAGLRTGNSWTATGQLVDRLAFVACADTRLNDRAGNALLEAATIKAAQEKTDVDFGNQCATMGEKLVIKPGQEVVVSVVVRDPSGTNYAPYSFNNPSLAQIGMEQPLNAPVLDHVDVVRGFVSGYKQPGAADYSGQWPNDWIDNPTLANVPDGAKNLSAGVLRTFNPGNWNSVRGHNSETRGYKAFTFRLSNLKASQYLRLRGSNLPAAVPFETDANGNPLADIYTNAGDPSKLTIPCTVTQTTVIPAGTTYTGNKIDGCPDHMERVPAVTGQKYVSYDVAAWADLWFYSNPIFIEVKGSTLVAGVK